MRPRTRSLTGLLLGLSLAAGAASAAGPAKAPDYAARLALVKEARLSEAFAKVAAKGHRPMPWMVFVANSYAYFKDGSRKAGGDLAADRDAAIWLAILDKEYRTQGRVIFVQGKKIPPVPADRWISLNDFETEIMPNLIFTPGVMDDKRMAAEVNQLVMRATVLHELSWAGLLVVPGAPDKGWRPLRPEDPAWRFVGEINAAYARGDAAAMRRGADKLAAALAAQPGYPARYRLALETVLEKYGLLRVAFGLYILSSLLFFVWLASRKRAVAHAGAWVAAAGLLFMTVGMVFRSLAAGYWPTTGMYEYLVLFAWAAVLFFLVFYLLTRQPILGVVVMPVAFLLLVLASLFPSAIEGQLIPALQSWWLTIHVTLACLGEGAFAVAFAAAVMRLFRGDRPGRVLPSAAQLEAIEYRAVTFGYPLFTVGALVAGAIWAQKAWSAWWSWDPKETAALVVFLIATAYLHARHVRGWQGRKLAVLAICIFLTSVLTLFANLIFGGLHSYGV